MESDGAAPEAQDADAGDAPLDAPRSRGVTHAQSLLELDKRVAQLQQTRRHVQRSNHQASLLRKLEDTAGAGGGPGRRGSTTGGREASSGAQASSPRASHDLARQLRMANAFFFLSSTGVPV